MSDPHTRALEALQHLYTPDLEPMALSAWQVVWDIILEAQIERAAFVSVAHEARALVEVMDDYEAAVAGGDPELVAKLADAGAAAEAALAEALSRVPAEPEAEVQLSGDAGHLAALDRPADENDDDALIDHHSVFLTVEVQVERPLMEECIAQTVHSLREVVARIEAGEEEGTILDEGGEDIGSFDLALEEHGW